MIRRLAFALLALALPGAAGAALPQEVDLALRAAGIETGAAAVYARRLDGPAAELAHNADAPFNPASVMKLLTTYAGLELLGPTHVWRTEFRADAAPVEGVVTGPLYLKGYGDPKLNLENLWLALRRLQQAGVRELRGGLVLDQSQFAPGNGDPGAFDGQPLRAYNAQPEALLAHYKVTALRLAVEGERVRVTVDPPADGIELVNRLRVSDAACNGWREALGADIRVNGKRVRIALDGSYSRQCEEREYLLSLFDTAEHFHGLFAQLWQQLGGRLAGGVRLGEAPAGAVMLLDWKSPPLAEIVRDINKHSHNLMARQLLLGLGATRRLPATPAAGDEAVRAWLAGKGLDFPELVIDNGSGLSRNARISARHLGELLAAAWASPVMPELLASLPIAGLDGTLKRRLDDNGVTGRARLKTGYLNGVKTLAGYLQDRHGGRWAVVFLINHPRAAAGGAAQDALLDWLWRGGQP